MPRTAFVKVTERSSLGVKRYRKVAEYKTREEADACTLDGTVMSVVQANKLFSGKK